MPHVTTHYRVIVAAGHHRRPRNSQKWVEPYAASNVEAVPGTPMNPFAPPTLPYTVDGQTQNSTFLFWSAGDGVDGESTTDQQLNTTVGTSPLTLVAWYLPVGGPGGIPGDGYIIDAFSDALNDFVDDDFVEVSPDAALTHDANVVGWVPTGNGETLKAVPGSISTGETFEQWIGGHPSDEVDSLHQHESGYALATYHNHHLRLPRVGDQYQQGIVILYGVTNDAPGLGYIPGHGPVPIDPGWGSLLRAVGKAAGLVSMSEGTAAAKEISRIATSQVNAAMKQFNAQAGHVAEH
jgi:hypothetical protein